jgi:SNF2 family DNA or RNA helicase
MIELRPKAWKTKPYAHQVEDVKELITHEFFAIFSEMGTGKSKSVIDAAATLFEAGKIDAVVVIAPASVKNVWLDAEFGQIKTHSWVRNRVMSYHSKTKVVWSDSPNNDKRDVLTWFVTNYEYVRPTRKDERRKLNFFNYLKDFELIMLVLDESSAVKDRTSGQYKSIRDLRKFVSRCVLLNGTPVPKNPLDLWAQLDILDHRILGRHYKNYYHFRWAHCNMGGWQNKQILGWRDLEKVRKIVKPHCLRRLKSDCLDLPPKIGGIDSMTPIVRDVQLTTASWNRYKTLRQEALLELPDTDDVLETNAAVRILRLAQLTSGYVSTKPLVGDDSTGENELSELNNLFVEPEIRDLSSEKLDWVTNFLVNESEAEATIVWSRFRHERERLASMLRRSNVKTFELYGGQSHAERLAAERSFDPSARGSGRRVLVAQQHAGGKGLQLHAATENIYLSNDYSLEYRLQSEDRSHRSGTIGSVSYVDVIAVGPNGQKTIDVVILKALRAKQDLATWTTSTWRRALKEE